MKPTIYIGTSGWHYKHWQGTFYPEGIKVAEQFPYYLQFFDTVEINNSFYRLPSEDTFSQWREIVPAHFNYAVKASRYITHMKKLMDPEQTLHDFMKHVRCLKGKLGVILFQLPPTWKINVQRFAEFASALPGGFRYAFEFRNHTWYDRDIYELLRKHNCAFCIYELAGHTSPLEVTADFIYIRLHGPGNKYQGSYPEETLKEWADMCRDWAKQKDVYMYFDNDEQGFAAYNALRLQELVRQ